MKLEENKSASFYLSGEKPTELDKSKHTMWTEGE
jgi:hypothetical protein